MRRTVLSLVFTGLVALGQTGISAEPHLLFAPGALGPWRIVHARVESDGPMTTKVSIFGRTWEGGRRLLFTTDGSPGLASFAAAFWLDDDIAAVVLDTGSGEDIRKGRETAVPTEAHVVPPELPFHEPRSGRIASSFSPNTGDLGTTASEASDLLFVSKPPLASALLLLILFAVTLVIAIFRGGRQRGSPPPRGILLEMAAGLLLSLGFGAAALVALPSEREFFAVALGAPPSATGAGTLPGAARPADAAGPTRAARPAAALKLRESVRGGWTLREWGDGPRRLVGIRLAPGRRFPLELLDRPGRTVRFSSPPFVVRGTDGLYLAGDRFVTGWFVDE